MPGFDDEMEAIEEIALEVTLYQRHFEGKVLSVTDSLNRGRIKVAVYELGWDTEDKAIWAWPGFNHGLDVPMVGEWVDIYFRNNNRDQCVYLGTTHHHEDDKKIKAYDGEPTTHVLYENPKDETPVIYDEKTGQFKVGKVANESFIKGDTFNTWVTSLINALNTHTHLGVTVGGGVTGAPVVPFTSPNNHLSDLIKGE